MVRDFLTKNDTHQCNKYKQFSSKAALFNMKRRRATKRNTVKLKRKEKK